MTIRIVLASFLLVFTWITASAAQAAIKHSIDIPAQGLGLALAELARQTGIQLVYPADLVAGMNAGAVTGSMTPQEALQKLLARTKLHFEFLDPRTVTLFSPATDQPRSQTTGPGFGRSSVIESTSEAILLAQAGTVASESVRSEQAGDSTRSGELPRPEESGKAIPEMLVKGSRTLNTDIQRTEDDVQPYVVFQKKEIRRSMAPDLEHFLKTRVPMNATQVTGAQNASSFASNRSLIDLRGLGGGQTLILVNGRQMPKGNNAGAFTQPDINAIPLAAIERIEILPSTASGIYGGGATGGVVNIITRQDYAGLEVNATYDNSFDTDSARRRLDLNAGFTLPDGKTQVMIYASHSDSNPLLRGDRDFFERSRALQLANNPNAFFGVTTPPRGYTSNVRSQNGSNLVLDDGTPLNSPFTFVPVGYAGPASDGGAALAANAGQYNLGQPDDIASDGASGSLISDTTVRSAMATVRRTFGERTEAYLDFSWLENQSESRTTFLTNSVTLAAGAPNNPFNTAIVVRFPGPEFSDLVQPFANESETLRAVGGVIFRLPGDWTAAADYTWSRSRGTTESTLAVGDPDGTGPGVPVSTALSNGTLDVMRDLNSFPLDYGPYLLPAPNSFREADTVLKDAALRVSGPIFRLPAGPVTLSGLVEKREEEAAEFFGCSMNSSGVETTSLFPSRSQDVDSYYLEARLPVFADQNARTLLQELEFQLSGRHDRYRTEVPSPSTVSATSREGPFPAYSMISNDVDATKATFGFRWAPTEDIALRVSSGTGFLAPAIEQLVPGQAFQITTTLIDPKRGNVPESVSIARSCCGNPNLDSESSESWSAGLILTPRFLEGLRLSLDFTHIEKTDEIALLSEQQLLDLEDAIPGRIARNPLTPEDIAAGYTGGAITAIDRGQVNLAKTELEAYDAQVDYTWQTERVGDFHLYVIATWQRSFERQTLEGDPVVDSVGFNLGPLEWRGNAGLTWERGPWMLAWSAQYYDSYHPYTATTSPAGIATSILNQGSSEIPSQTYHDVLAGYSFDSSMMSGWLEDTELRLGVRNVFNESPPILAAFTDGYSRFGDPRLRVYSISLRKGF